MDLELYYGAQARGAQLGRPLPSWVSSLIPTCPPRPHGHSSALCLCSAPTAREAGICPGGCVRGEPSREGQCLLPDQLGWLRKGGELLGTQVLLSAHKQPLSSALLLASWKILPLSSTSRARDAELCQPQHRGKAPALEAAPRWRAWQCPRGGIQVEPAPGAPLGSVLLPPNCPATRHTRRELAGA